MRVFLAGASRVIGRQLLPLLADEGYFVTATTRSPASLETIRRLGADPVVCDVFDHERLLSVITEAEPDAVINQLTNIPNRLRTRRFEKDMHETNRLRTEGTKSLIEAAKASGVARILTQSIAFAYVPQGARPATEHEPLFTHAPKGFASVTEAVAASERLTSETPGLEGTVLRYGFFYGPGTVYSRGGSFTIDISRRRVPIIGSGSGIFSFIHVRDAAIATIAALKHLATGIYNIVDDEPVPVRTWLPEYARLLGAPAPRNAPRWLGRLVGGPYANYLMVQQRGASNAKARADLNWRPQYADWRDGFDPELVGR